MCSDPPAWPCMHVCAVTCQLCNPELVNRGLPSPLPPGPSHHAAMQTFAHASITCPSRKQLQHAYDATCRGRHRSETVRWDTMRTCSIPLKFIDLDAYIIRRHHLQALRNYNFNSARTQDAISRKFDQQFGRDGRPGERTSSTSRSQRIVCG